MSPRPAPCSGNFFRVTAVSEPTYDDSGERMPVWRDPTIRRLMKWIGRLFALALVGLVAFWMHCEYVTTQAHAGLDGEWVEFPGSDTVYLFERNGTFYRRAKPGDAIGLITVDGTIFHLYGTWTRNGNTVTVTTPHDWGLVVTPAEDGTLPGVVVLNTLQPNGTKAKATLPTVLRQK